ncbi:MAG: translocation/assembly module TamB domain-containing protein, partial [Burkholderiales bacterium]
SGEFNGNMHLTGGGLQHIMVETELKPSFLTITIPQHFANPIPHLNIIKTLPEKSPLMIHEKPAYLLSLIDLQLNIEAQKQIYIKGSGVDAELAGNLLITGTAAAPLTHGKLHLIKGKYEKFDKLFTLKEATLLFDGPIPPAPFIHIVGAAQANDVEVRPVLTGPLSTAALRIESTPSMPQEEALSKLLFGKEIKNISPFQALKLADNLRSLSNHESAQFNPIDKIRKLIGLDELKFNKTESNSEYTVGAGKYLTDKIYIELESGAANETSKARIEVEVSPHISIESETSQTAPGHVGIQWKYDY